MARRFNSKDAAFERDFSSFVSARREVDEDVDAAVASILADVRSRYSSILYGDQAMFMTAAVFAQVGGFPEIALMEDVAMSRNLRHLGRVAVCKRRVQVSGRRFESAPIYQTLIVNLFPLLYAAGVSPRTLARLYGNPR